MKLKSFLHRHRNTSKRLSRFVVFNLNHKEKNTYIKKITKEKNKQKAFRNYILLRTFTTSIFERFWSILIDLGTIIIDQERSGKLSKNQKKSRNIQERSGTFMMNDQVRSGSIRIYQNRSKMEVVNVRSSVFTLRVDTFILNYYPNW